MSADGDADSDSGSGADSGPGRREVAHRLFAAEFDDATVSYAESDEERAPKYVVTPTGARVNRLFAVGVLTEVESVNEDVLRARVVDPTGAFVSYAGQYQPDAAAFFERADPPAFVALTGKARTFEPDDGDRIYTSVRPESVSTVDAETRDRWTASAAEATLRRVAAMADAKAMEAPDGDLRAALEARGYDESLAAGIPVALDRYGTTTAYLDAVRRMAVDALAVVAGERDAVRSLDVSPGEAGPESLGPLPEAVTDAGTAGAAGESGDATAAESPDSAAVDDSDATDGATTGAVANEATDGADATTDAATSDATEGAADATDETATDATDETAADATDETADAHERTPDEAPASTDGAAAADDDATADARETPDEPAVEETTAAEEGPDDFDGEELGDFDDDDLYELDDEERREVEESFDVGFESGAEVDDPGEADIDVPGPEDLDGDAATGDAEGESAGDAERETTDEAEREPDAAGESEPDAEAAEAPDAASVDLESAAIEVMDDLDDGDGAEREAVVERVVDEHGVDPGAVADAIEDALMSGRCYEPTEDRLKAI